MNEMILDGNFLTDTEKAHPYLKEALQLPEYYGNNLDALYDCLTELEHTKITITPPEENGFFYQKIIRVFKAAAEENDALELFFKST